MTSVQPIPIKLVLTYVDVRRLHCFFDSIMCQVTRSLRVFVAQTKSRRDHMYRVLRVVTPHVHAMSARQGYG